MIINLPARLNRGSMTSLLNQVVSEIGEPLHEKYVFDFHGCNKFIEPIGVTFLHNLIRWLDKRDIPISFNYPIDSAILSNKRHPIRFLDDCGFFEEHIGEKLYKHSSLRDTTVKLQEVGIHDFYTWLPDHLIKWIGTSIDKSYEELDTFKICIEEVFNNVRDHAEVSESCIFAQHIPNNNTIIVSITDIGVGIVNRVKSDSRYKDYSDKEALENSVRREFTTKSTPKNRGMGLDNLVYNIVMNAKGTVYIYANKGILIARRHNGEMVCEYTDAGHYYPGTHIEVQFDASEAESLFDIVEEEFSWL